MVTVLVLAGCQTALEMQSQLAPRLASVRRYDWSWILVSLFEIIAFEYGVPMIIRFLRDEMGRS